MPKKTKEEIQEKINALEQKKSFLQGQEKILMKEDKGLVRRARSHRLIERGAMLESYFIRPALLSNDQVKTILEEVFSTRIAELMIEEMIKKAEEQCTEEI